MVQLRAVTDQSPEDDEYSLLLDPLTRLPKRALLNDRVSIALARARRNNCAVGIVVVRTSFRAGLDPKVRAAAVADRAALLTSLVRPDDTLARLLDATFVVICNDIRSQVDLDQVQSRLESGIDDHGRSDALTATTMITRMAIADDDPQQVVAVAFRLAST